MKFARPAIEAQYAALHPEVRAKLEDADAFVQGQGWEEVYVTCVKRTDDDQERIYLPYAERLVADLAMGIISAKEKALAKTLAEMTPEQRKGWARAKFSWHLVDCAADIRNRCYTAAQRKSLMERLRKGTSTTTHEVIEHDVGRGNHIHVGRKDFGWRKARGK